MSVSTVDSLSQANFSRQAQRNEPTLQETDGFLVVKSGDSEHPLQSEHCKDCLTLFKGIQINAKRGGSEAKDLLQRAQEQMESLQSNQIRALQKNSVTPVAYATPKSEASLSISFSNAAQLRARNLSRIASASTQMEQSQLAGAPRDASPKDSGVEPLSSASLDGEHSETGPENRDNAQSTANPTSPESEQHNDTAGHSDASHGDATNAHHGSDPAKSLSEAELKEVRELSQRDNEVRAHEQAHKSAAGSHGGSISLTYKQGPDGKRYAVEGEVPVDLSAVKGDPEATVAKMEQIHRAALAPAQPSSADRRVAARAAQKASKARQEIIKGANEENPLKKAHGTDEKIQVRDPDEAPQGSEGAGAGAEAGASVDGANTSRISHGDREPKPGVVTPSEIDISAKKPEPETSPSETPEPPTKLTERPRRTASPYAAYAKSRPTPAANADIGGMVSLKLNVYA